MDFSPLLKQRQVSEVRNKSMFYHMSSPVQLEYVKQRGLSMFKYIKTY